MTDKPTRQYAHTNLPILFPSPALTPQGCVTDAQLLTLFNAGFIAQLKVDGVRLRIHVTVHADGAVKVHSIRTRSGDPISPNLEVAIISLLTPTEPIGFPVGKEDQDYLIEAEFLYGGDMQKTAGRVHSTRLDIALSKCQLYLFDCIRRDPDNQMYWLTSEPYLVRYGYLAQFVDLDDPPQQVFRLPILSKADQSKADQSEVEPIGWAQSLATTYGIEFEGVVLKDPKAPYTPGRSPNIQRWKQQAEHQAQVLDVEEMTTFDLKPTGMVGSFKCLDITTGIQFSLSASSLPHSLRRAVWEHRDTFLPPRGPSGADSPSADRPAKPTILTYTALAFGVKSAPRMPRVVKSDIIKHLTKIGALPNE